MLVDKLKKINAIVWWMHECIPLSDKKSGELILKLILSPIKLEEYYSSLVEIEDNSSIYFGEIYHNKKKELYQNLHEWMLKHLEESEMYFN